MARPHFGNTVGGSLEALAKFFNIGFKGDEVYDADGKRFVDFSAYDLQRYGKYCQNDVNLTRKLYNRLAPLTNRLELAHIHNTITMFTRPVLRLDVPLLEQHLEEIQDDKRQALEAAGVDIKTIRSDAKLAEEIRARGYKPPRKISPRTGKETYAFSKDDKGFTDLLNCPDPDIQSLVEARLKCKSTIQESRTERFIGIAKRGPFPVPLSYAGANVTWRWAGTDKVNLQNLPHKGNLRNAIQAPRGYVLVVVDSSNIELRINHTAAGSHEVVSAVREGRDVYAEFATDLYGYEVNKYDTPDERFVGKVAHLSLGYNCGWEKFRAMCRIKGIILSESEARRIVGTFREIYDALPRMWRSWQEALQCLYDGFPWQHPNDDVDVWANADQMKLMTPPNHFIEYHRLRKNQGEFSYQQRKGKSFQTAKIYGGKVDENFCQHIARNIIAEQWAELAEYYRVVMQVHDEVVMCVKEEDADACLAHAIEVMSTSPKWWPDLPLAAEGAFAENYGDAK